MTTARVDNTNRPKEADRSKVPPCGLPDCDTSYWWRYICLCATGCSFRGRKRSIECVELLGS